ncbi:MAG: class I poly(R)-hydroxyalkanoic acid synthase, partial [Bradyrhizobium sp.]|nr:class I poly(R)-hydroxyalkanoic acid synthase [Bradyrhizobium sp.]
MKAMADNPKTANAMPTLEDWQHWTLVMGRAQQMLMEFWAEQVKQGQAMPAWSTPAFGFGEQGPASGDPMALMSAGAQAWAKGLETWGKMLGGVTAGAPETERKDRRFSAPEWSENPIFDTIRKTYLQISDQLLGTVDDMEGVDTEMREKLRFATRSFVDAMSPSNFALTNPQVLKRTMETRGENLLKGLGNMLKDISSGQLTQTKSGAFEVGRNLAMTPGKVVRQTPLYQLIQYTPTTPEVMTTPVVIFPPWINRFYILDLTPEKSFVKWCVDQGIS